MPHLILVRHGQSEWNLEKRFTGWVDINLTAQGKLEACKSGEYIKQQKLIIDYFFSSFQLRAINTLKLIQDVLRNNKKPIRAWQLNERHYGSLTGLNKIEMKEKLGVGGLRELSVRVWIDPVKLAANDLTIQEIEKALRNENVSLPAGTLEANNVDLTLNLDKSYNNIDKRGD